MRDYPNILVVFLDDFKDGYEFEHWPHHITILPWFKADRQALDSIETIAVEHLPLHIELGETDMIGPRSDILVRLVGSSDLRRLHHALIQEREGVLGFANSRFTGSDFLPHVTLQGIGDPDVGSREIKAVSLVKTTPEPNKVKRVEANFTNSK